MVEVVGHHLRPSLGGVALVLGTRPALDLDGGGRCGHVELGQFVLLSDAHCKEEVAGLHSCLAVLRYGHACGQTLGDMLGWRSARPEKLIAR